MSWAGGTSVRDAPAGAVPGPRRPGRKRVAGLAAAVVLLTGAAAAAVPALASRTTSTPGASPSSSTGPTSAGQGAHPLSLSGNLLVGQSADFDGGIGSWFGYTSGTSVAPSAVAQSGSGSMMVTNASRAAAYVASGSPRTATATPATPGETYSATIESRAAATGAQVAGVLVFYSSSGTPTGSAWGQQVEDTNSAWTPTIPVVGLAPPGTAWVVLYVTMTDVAPGAAQYLDSASITSGGGGAAPIVGPLHTQGNRIYDAYGAVVLRGVVLNGTQASTAGFPGDAEMGHAAAWGANFVRVPLSESLWLNTCTAAEPSNSSAYPAEVAALVSSITSRHMVALLDLHFSVTHLCGAPAPQAMADATYAPAFWGQVASRFASNPLVAFDLYNEPHDISDSVWLNGGTSVYGGIPFRVAGMRQLYDTVRAAAPTNLVFASGNDWGNDPPSAPLTGTNIVDAVHDYSCPQTASTACPTTDPYDPMPILNRWSAVEATTPVMVTEFGFPRRFDGRFNTNLVAAAEQAGIGWAAFAWDRTTGEPWSLLADVGAAHEPLPAGMPVLAGLTRN